MSEDEKALTDRIGRERFTSDLFWLVMGHLIADLQKQGHEEAARYVAKHYNPDTLINHVFPRMEPDNV